MKTRFHRQLIGISVAAACAVACAPGAISASNPFARFEYNAQKQTGAIDLSFSVDWNVSAPPTIMPTATGAPVPLDQAYLQALIRETARTVFAMSNGAHTLRNVYIYDNSQFMNTADIRIHNRDGRSNANISGWLRPGTRNEIFPTMGNQVETPEQTGQVIAHELGHYFYGVFDEYVEAGRPLSADNPGSPAATDTAKNTVMHDQYQWWNFSSSADYADPAAQATAQFRVYKASAWDTLVRNPTLDPLLDGYSPRHSFEPFKTWGAAPGVSNEAARQTHDLPAAVESVSMTLNPPVRSLVLIDLLAPAGEVEGQKNAVARMIDNLGASTTFGVAATNPAGTLQWVVAPAKLAAGAERDAAKQAVNALAEASGSSVDISGALKELLAAATTDAAAQGNFVTLFASNRIVVGNPAQLVAETGVATKTVAFTQITLGNQSHAESLSEFLVASTRPAQRYSVNSGSEIGRVAGRATQNEKAKSESTVVEDEIETLLKKGETVTRDIVLSAYDTTASFLVFGGDDDIGHLTATLTGPGGQTIAANRHDADGYIEFPVANAAAGKWSLSLSASENLKESVGYSVEVESSLTLDLGTVGGTAADPRAPVLQAALDFDGRAVLGATVLADIFDESGVPVAKSVALLDDGKNGDAFAGDGIYSANLLNRIAAGKSYDLVVAASAPNGARASEAGQLVKGSNAQETPLTPFNRYDEMSLFYAGSTAAGPTVTEFYHAGFGHYFITASAEEAAAIDSGRIAGWARTGQTFKVLPLNAAGAANVCRFFSTGFAPKSSHFYTPSAAECATVKGNPNWQFEAEVFSVTLPSAAGTCPTGTAPLYRMYNNGQSGAPNHRFTTSTSIRATMLSQGWVPEGAGALGVGSCVPN